MPLGAAVPPRSSGCDKMQTRLSSWTPLNHLPSNTKVFEERRNLLAKWFDRWSDSQRKAVLQDLVLSCSVDQLSFLSLSVSRRLPLQAADFTSLLPRALSLYIFSFLDPRSLCRCAQVSWCWRSIVELDQLWMPKCIRLGWFSDFSLTPMEQGAWRRRYIQTVQQLRLSSLQATSSQQQFVAPKVSSIRPEDPSEGPEERSASTSRPFGNISRTGRRKEKQPAAPPPWRDADRRPEDTRRFNYLDNLQPSELNRTSTCSHRGGKTLSEAHYKLRKAKSLMFLSSSCRTQHPPSPPPPPPHHHHDIQSGASHSHDHLITSSVLRLAQWNAGIRPGPVRSSVPRLSMEALRASRRSHRSTPDTPLFQPWTE